jgi:hypothetical protein
MMTSSSVQAGEQIYTKIQPSYYVIIVKHPKQLTQLNPTTPENGTTSIWIFVNDRIKIHFVT